jgi:hypothetical protein
LKSIAGSDAVRWSPLIKDDRRLTGEATPAL